MEPIHSLFTDDTGHRPLSPVSGTGESTGWDGARDELRSEGCIDASISAELTAYPGPAQQADATPGAAAERGVDMMRLASERKAQLERLRLAQDQRIEDILASRLTDAPEDGSGSASRAWRNADPLAARPESARLELASPPDAPVFRSGNQELEDIKARTMWRMVEDIMVGSQAKKVLFLSNRQAEILAHNQGSMAKVLDALEIPTPKLVVNLLKSSPKGVFYSRGHDNILPYVDSSDAMKAEARLEEFMRTVLIPLAVETNALVIGTANKDECLLTMAFSSAVEVEQAKWGSKAPFTFLGYSCSMKALYRSDQDSFWTKVRDQSINWQSRDRLLREMSMSTNSTKASSRRADLASTISLYLLVDSINEQSQVVNDKSAMIILLEEFMRYMASSRACISIKSGRSSGTDGGHSHLDLSSLNVAVNVMKAGCPLLFLDLRDRPSIFPSNMHINEKQNILKQSSEKCDTYTDPVEIPKEKYNRETVIETAMDLYESRLCSHLMQLDPPLADTLDVMHIAYLADVLFGDANPSSSQYLQVRF